jgi:hypothetical protein
MSGNILRIENESSFAQKKGQMAAGYNNEPEIRITGGSGDTLEFVLSKTDLSIANALRRFACGWAGLFGMF